MEKQVFVSKLYRADNMLSRLIGLLRFGSLPEGHGMLITPCKQVHTFFMRFAIDVVFLDGSNRILKTSSLKPWRMSPLVWGATSVLELREGAATELSEGEKLLIADDNTIYLHRSD